MALERKIGGVARARLWARSRMNWAVSVLRRPPSSILTEYVRPVASRAMRMHRAAPAVVRWWRRCLPCRIHGRHEVNFFFFLLRVVARSPNALDTACPASLARRLDAPSETLLECKPCFFAAKSAHSLAEPTSPELQLEPVFHRVMLPRRLRLQLPLSLHCVFAGPRSSWLCSHLRAQLLGFAVLTLLPRFAQQQDERRIEVITNSFLCRWVEVYGLVTGQPGGSNGELVSRGGARKPAAARVLFQGC